MNIRSPQDGIITTWEVKKNLMGRPVEIGHELLKIAAIGGDGDWVLEVEVPDDDMGPILWPRASSSGRSPPARSNLAPPSAPTSVATNPEHRYQGYVRRIAAKAETVEQKHVVKVTVGFDEAVRQDFLSRNQELRPGAEVRARVDCGKTNLAYYLLRKPSRSSTSRCCSAGRSCARPEDGGPVQSKKREGRSPLPTNEIADETFPYD